MKKAAALGMSAALFLFGSPLYAQQAAKAPTAAPSPQSSSAIPDTLMFTTDEFNEIRSHLASAVTRGDDRAIENATLYLSTIVYVGPNDWKIWVNGHPIGPNEEFQAFKVTDISPDFVELLVPLSAQGIRPVRLGANQTFIIKSGVVVEGAVK